MADIAASSRTAGSASVFNVVSRASKTFRAHKALRLLGALAALTALVVPDAAANPASSALRSKATIQAYNLDRDEAIATFREAVAADQQDPAAYRGLAAALWLSIT